MPLLCGKWDDFTDECSSTALTVDPVRERLCKALGGKYNNDGCNHAGTQQQKHYDDVLQDLTKLLRLKRELFKTGKLNTNTKAKIVAQIDEQLNILWNQDLDIIRGDNGNARKGDNGNARKGDNGNARKGDNGNSRNGNARNGDNGNARNGNARNGDNGNARNGDRCYPKPQCTLQTKDHFTECNDRLHANKPVACCINKDTHVCTIPGEKGETKIRMSSSGGNGGRKKQTWISTKRTTTVKSVKKTVYRNTTTGELRVRKMVSKPDGRLRATYVKF
jgi:hypothetical protein